MPPLDLLKSHFGFDGFLPLQEEIVGQVLAQRDALVVMPTGGGKSLCYQLPAVCFDGLTVVVSPLIALMKDQVDSLKANGIAADFINSTMAAKDIVRVQTQARNGSLKILYLAPERLALAGFKEFLRTLDVNLFAIWSEPEVTFTGKHFQLKEVSLGLLPVQQPGVPLWMAGTVDTARKRMLRLGDGWFPNPPTTQSFIEGWDRIKELAAETGDDAEKLHRCVYTTLNINEDTAQAEQEMRAFVEGYYGSPFETASRTQSVCAGNAAKCTSWLKSFVDAGAQTIVIRFGGPDQQGQLQRCAQEVLTKV